MSATVPAGMNLNSDGYLRFHAPKRVKDRYAHRLYADRQMRESLGRGLLPTEEVHHLCGNRQCWPPTDYHLLICDAALHHAMDAGRAPHWKRKKFAAANDSA
jgi:hypothetical protein